MLLICRVGGGAHIFPLLPSEPSSVLSFFKCMQETSVFLHKDTSDYLDGNHLVSSLTSLAPWKWLNAVSNSPAHGSWWNWVWSRKYLIKWVRGAVFLIHCQISAHLANRCWSEDWPVGGHFEWSFSGQKKKGQLALLSTHSLACI